MQEVLTNINKPRCKEIQSESVFLEFTKGNGKRNGNCVCYKLQHEV